MITPDVPGIPGVTPDLRVAHHSPLKKNRIEGHLGQKAITKMGDILWSKMELCPTSLTPWDRLPLLDP